MSRSINDIVLDFNGLRTLDVSEYTPYRIRLIHELVDELMEVPDLNEDDFSRAMNGILVTPGVLWKVAGKAR